MGISVWQLLILLVVVILIFGTKKLRGVGKDLGAAVHDFKEGLNQETSNSAKSEKVEDKNSDDKAV
ncbi:MAG: twin-arginine translocase TatA/TatE family subunit [Neisseriaceae bacterium]|nr:twin-arginine translocase TatA/TatE family subunit [Neisseriaceae bacterium]